MKELLEAIPRATFPIDHGVLLDTCFVFNLAQHQKSSLIDELAKRRQVLISSFNAEEILLKNHQVEEPIKERLRHWLKHTHSLQLLQVPVHPGDWAGERSFVQAESPEILAKTHDASDAVLLAAALHNGCDILTKDKHHIFTTLLENFMNHRGIRIEKDIHDL